MNELLLKDLCTRLPYGVIVHLKYDKNTSITKELGIGSLHDIMVGNAEGKPYLRPMSSMTIEEIKNYRELCTWDYVEHYEFGEPVTEIQYNDTWESIDYLNSIHVDYRGLIPMGLALEALKDMYKL